MVPTVDVLRRRGAGHSYSTVTVPTTPNTEPHTSHEKGLTYPRALGLAAIVVTLTACSSTTLATATQESPQSGNPTLQAPTPAVTIESPAQIEATATPKIEISMPAPIDGLYYGSYGVDSDNRQVVTGAIDPVDFNNNNPNSPYKVPSYGNGEVQVNTLYSETNSQDAAATMLDQKWLDGYFNAQTDKTGIVTGTLPDGSTVTKQGLFWVDSKGDVLNPLVRNIVGENFGWPMLVVKDNKLFTAVVDGNGQLVGDEQFHPAFQSPSAIAESVGFDKPKDVTSVVLSQTGILQMFDNQARLIGEIVYVGNAEIAPLIEVDGVVIKDPAVSNPELFDVTDSKSPLSKFVNAFVVKQEGETGAAFETRRQTAINEVTSGLKPNLFIIEDKQYVILTTQDISSTQTTNESNIPLIIAEKNESNEWVWSEASIKKMCELNGLQCGATISVEGNPQYDELLVNEFSIINSGGTSPQSVATEGLRYEKKYSLFAQENGLSFRPAHLFDWGDQNPAELNTASQAQISEWMNKWVQDVVNGYPYFNSINFANEPVGIYDGSQYWVTEGNPWYRAYQEQWPVEAYSMIYNQLEAKGLKPGEDVHLILNLPYGVKEWGYNPQFTIDFMAQIKKQIQAKIGPDAKMDVGIQFHLRDVPVSQADWGGPDIKDLNAEELKIFFQELGKIGPVHITEFSVKNISDPNKVMDGVNLVLSSAIQSGAVEDVVFWEGIENSDFLFNAELQNNPNYYLLLQTLLSNIQQ